MTNFLFIFLNFLMVSIKIGQNALSSKSGKSNRALLVVPEYSSVPNRRAGQNKRACGKILKKQ